MPEPVEVQTGDSIPSLAVEYGFFWRTIWDHGENARLRALRKNPNVLLPGDRVYIPEKRERHVEKPVDGQHKFKRKGEPAVIRLQLLQDDEPRANEPYKINVDNGRIIRDGATDSEGILEEVIPGDARCVELLLKGGKESHQFAVGKLNPVEEIIGVQQRLNNLGYEAGPEDNEMNPQLADAITRFQGRYNLTQTGEIDAALKAKLQELTQ